MELKLIPIVTTEADVAELARTYTRRWPAQENVIRDGLIPLGIDVNHGYAKTLLPTPSRKGHIHPKRLPHTASA